MPVEFLSTDQAQWYGRYAGEPTPAQLARYFHLDDVDRARVAKHRGDHNRLGFALQLGTARFLGTFLEDPTDVPAGVIAYLTHHLRLAEPVALARYGTNPTRWEHMAEIRQHYGYRDFSDQPGHFQFVRWLFARAWLTAGRPSVLFDVATQWLVEHKVVLPGVTVLARLVARVRDRSAIRLWQRLAHLPDAAHRARLEALLVIPTGSRQSPFDRLRRPPTRVSAPGLLEALDRLTELRALGPTPPGLTALPPSRLQALARAGATVRAQALTRQPEPRRLATLVALISRLQVQALDDAVDLFDVLIGSLLSRAERRGHQNRLRTLRDLDAAALQLRAACLVVLDLDQGDADLRAAVFRQTPRQQLVTAAATVAALAQSPDEGASYRELLTRYGQVRRFLPAFFRAIPFASTESGRALLEALSFLRQLDTDTSLALQAAPRNVIPRPWRRLVVDHRDRIDRRAYTFCILEQLQSALRRRDIFVPGSDRWGDPRAKLLAGPAWESLRSQVCRTLSRSETPEADLAALQVALDAAYRQTVGNLPANTAVRVESSAGRDELVVSPLDKLPEPASLLTLRQQTSALLPRVDLPELLLEVAAWTGFPGEFSHLSEGNARVDDLTTSICAVLLAEACNVGLEPLVRSDVPALTRSRLSWVQQNYLRAETLRAANARLVEFQTTIPLVHHWGVGEVASADGLRFVVPVRTINAGPNPKYFGVGRGVTYYNYTSDQFTGFHGIVIPGTLRDSLFILDGLLEQQTRLQPRELMADTAGSSDVVFGLFWLLGYQFSPRLADIGETSFWRLDPAADYGALNGLARHRLNTDVIARHWDDLLRVAGSLQLGVVSASELMRTFQAGGRQPTLVRAIAEVGRIAKTLYLLAYLDDEAYRRRILAQLNRGEGRHSLARAMFHGQRGELRQHYREGQEDQLSALGLVVNAVVLWNSRYLNHAIGHLQHHGQGIVPDLLDRLSPLQFSHINLVGRYSFALAEPFARGELRPLRDPSDPEELDALSA